MYSYFLLKWKFMRLIFFEFQKICVKWSASYLASYFVSMIIINGKNFKIFCIMAHAKKCTYRRNKTKPTKSRRRTPMAIFFYYNCIIYYIANNYTADKRARWQLTCNSVIKSLTITKTRRHINRQLAILSPSTFYRGIL